MSLREFINTLEIFIFVVCNLVKLVIGIKLLEFTLDALQPYSTRIFFLAMLNGILIVLMAFIGFWTAGRCSSSKMNLFAKILFVAFVTSVLLIICFYGNWEEIPAATHSYFLKKFNNMKNSQKNIVFVESVQKSLDCCGVSGPADYASIGSFWGAVKKSAQSPGQCSIQSITNNVGCAKKLGHYIQNSIEKIALVSILVDSLLIVITQVIILTLGPEQDGYEIEVLKKLSIPIEIPENYVADPNIPDSDIEDAEIAEAIMAGLNMDNAVIAEDAIAN